MATQRLVTDGATIREVTGWGEIDFVGDDDQVVVHFGHNGSPYALWTDARGCAQTLGDLTMAQLVRLGSRQQDAVANGRDDMATKEPVTIGGWYENVDGTVSKFAWRQHKGTEGRRLELDRTVASWADVPSQDAEYESLVAGDAASRGEV